MPSELGECMIAVMPAKYSSSAMKVSDMKDTRKFNTKKTLVEQRVDRCLQNWNMERMIEFIAVLDYQARFLPLLSTSRSYRSVVAQAP